MFLKAWNSTSTSEIHRCSGHGHWCFTGCWQAHILLFIQLWMNYVARANWLSFWNNVNGQEPPLRLSSADFWDSFPHGTCIIQKLVLPARFALDSPGALWLGFELEGLCFGHVDSTEPRVRQPGFPYQLTSLLWASVSLKMKSSIPMSVY